MSKCEEILAEAKKDPEAIGFTCEECTGQGGTEDVPCPCCNGRGEHPVIRLPKKDGLEQ